MGCLYLLLALTLAIVFVPTLLALFICLLSVCIFNTGFYKIVAIGSFNKAIRLVTFWLGKAAESFRDSENLT